eukprot:Cvel_27336.t1-p1 / transcript=Cvel_27336.t1 / gene=Cvel_27336 / organism=Chromera_velia_CCMP2878 / gene_product=hypothetical protein / transcript_product=hypothetical protein / location=Cvel_scaffold3393:267-12866(-) / protein_length=337 / sequence_SO=supercontig / SO=protein_coding / is_pseudo=false
MEINVMSMSNGDWKKMIDDFDMNNVGAGFRVHPRRRRDARGNVRVFAQIEDWHTTPAFEEFLRHPVIKCVKWQSPAGSLIRLLSKAAQLGLDYELNDHHVNACHGRLFGETNLKRFDTMPDSYKAVITDKFYILPSPTKPGHSIMFLKSRRRAPSCSTVSSRAVPLNARPRCRGGRERREEPVHDYSDDEEEQMDDDELNAMIRLGSESPKTEFVGGDGDHSEGIRGIWDFSCALLGRWIESLWNLLCFGSFLSLKAVLALLLALVFVLLPDEGNDEDSEVGNEAEKVLNEVEEKAGEEGASVQDEGDDEDSEDGNEAEEVLNEVEEEAGEEGASVQ